MNPNRKTEFLVGLFLLIGLLMLGGIVLQFGRVREAFRGSYTLSVAFPNAPGIKAGSPVDLGGSRIGKVKGKPLLKEDSSGVVIDLEIFEGTEVPLDALFSVGSAGLMGDALIQIKIPPTDQPITAFYPHDHDKIIEGDKGGGLSALQSSAESVAKKVELTLDDVRTALVDLQSAMKKINEGALADTTIQDFKDSMSHLKDTMQRVDERVLGDENAAALRDALADIAEAAASFKKAAAHVEGTTAQLSTTLAKLDPTIEKADKVMTSADAALIAVKLGVDDFRILARQATDGSGLMAALLTDPQLKQTFSDLINNLKNNGVLFYKDTAEKDRAQGGTTDLRTPFGKR